MAEAAARERDVRLAAIAALVATRAFDEVYAYSMPEDRGQRAGDLRAAAVVPVSGSNTLEDDDVTTGSPRCRMTFHVVVMSRNEDPIVRDEVADKLLTTVQNAINGQSLGGLTFPQFTFVASWAWLPEKPPERQVRCVVQAQYETPGWDDFNTSE